MPERLAFRFASVSLVACWCVLPATAAELAIRDVGVEFLTLPSDFDYEITSSTRSVSGSDGFDSAYGLRLGGAYSFTGPGDRSGLLVGAGALISRRSMTAHAPNAAAWPGTPIPASLTRW